MPDEFDQEANRLEASMQQEHDFQQQEHDANEARKRRIEDATNAYHEGGMQYSRAYERASTEELTRSAGRGKRNRNNVVTS
jgi:hypothetical protein